MLQFYTSDFVVMESCATHGGRMLWGAPDCSADGCPDVAYARNMNIHHNLFNTWGPAQVIFHTSILIISQPFVISNLKNWYLECNDIRSDWGSAYPDSPANSENFVAQGNYHNGSPIDWAELTSYSLFKNVTVLYWLISGLVVVQPFQQESKVITSVRLRLLLLLFVLLVIVDGDTGGELRSREPSEPLIHGFDSKKKRQQYSFLGHQPHSAFSNSKDLFLEPSCNSKDRNSFKNSSNCGSL